MKQLLLTGCLSLPLALTLTLTPTMLAAQQELDTDQLRREQDEIIRKAERLRDLMTRLLERYQKEERRRQVELIQEGLKHLEESGLLEDVTGARRDLDARALAEANRKQGKVIRELEKLLTILLDRNSLENLEEQLAEAARLAEQAARLEQRQAKLQEQTVAAARIEPSAAEKKMLERIREMTQRQRDESQRNLNAAGVQRPSLEQALNRIEQLLKAQERL